MRSALGVVLLFGLSIAGCSHSRERSGDAGPTPDGGGRDGGGRDGSQRTDAGFGYCSGNTPSDIDCRNDSECECGNCLVGPICAGPGCASFCASDADCDGGICVGGCCPYCIPRCPETVCAEGTRCNDTTGHCDLIPCDESGAACPTNTRCTPGSAGDGCVRLTCTTDADCDCGTCAEGHCWDRPGQCCPPLPG